MYSVIVTITETIRNRLAAALEAGRSLRSVSIEAGVHWGQLGRFLRGQRMLTGESLDRLANTLGVVAVVKAKKRRAR